MSSRTFLQTEFIDHLKRINPETPRQWGVLSPQGMIEHMTESVAIAWGRIKQAPVTPPEYLEKTRAFALSDKEFKPNTKNVYMGEAPAALYNPDIPAAIKELEQEIRNFFDFYASNPGTVITNPFFGDFNEEEWLHLLEKHGKHHLKQFGLI